MRRLIVMHSIHRPEKETEKDEFNSILSEFEIEHLTFEKNLKIPGNTEGIIFSDGIDCIQITRTIKKLLNKKIPMVRIYPFIKGYGEVENVAVMHTKDSACDYIKRYFQN